MKLWTLVDICVNIKMKISRMHRDVSCSLYTYDVTWVFSRQFLLYADVHKHVRKKAEQIHFLSYEELLAVFLLVAFLKAQQFV